MSSLPVNQLRTNSKRLDLGDAKVFHLPNWNTLSHPERLRVLRQIAMMRARDPSIAKLAVSIFKDNKVQPRDYRRQAEVLLKWVQNPKNVYYVNEPGERLQDPIHTIKIGHGDCDDQALLLTCLFESVGLPWKYVLSGRNANGEKVRHIEGEKIEPNTKWSHIYCMVGTPPFNPNEWYFCETTVVGVPLGWDVVSGDHSYLPEMVKSKGGPPQIMVPGPANGRYRPAPLPPKAQQSPAYAMALGGYGDVDPVGSQVGGQVGYEAKEIIEKEVKSEAKYVMGWAIFSGVAISLSVSLLMQWINGEGYWKGSDHLFRRWGKSTEQLATKSRLFVSPFTPKKF